MFITWDRGENVDTDDEADDGDLRRKTVSASNQNPHLRSD